MVVSENDSNEFPDLENINSGKNQTVIRQNRQYPLNRKLTRIFEVTQTS